MSARWFAESVRHAPCGCDTAHCQRLSLCLHRRFIQDATGCGDTNSSSRLQISRRAGIPIQGQLGADSHVVGVLFFVLRVRHDQFVAGDADADHLAIAPVLLVKNASLVLSWIVRYGTGGGCLLSQKPPCATASQGFEFADGNSELSSPESRLERKPTGRLPKNEGLTVREMRTRAKSLICAIVERGSCGRTLPV